MKIRFDAGQALKEVERLGLARQEGSGFQAISPEKGLEKLKTYWSKLLMPKLEKDAMHTSESKIDGAHEFALQN